MNDYLAALVDELYHLGVRSAVFSPGSRSTALAMLFENYGKFKTYVNIDERSAAFFGLGIAKAELKPVVLLCTSGTAGAHYLPALAEAKLSGVPLIAITADRPAELRFVGAPQTMDQFKLFGDFVNHFEELAAPMPEAKDYWTYPRMVAQKAYLKALSDGNGPVHLNVPLRDPLIPDLTPENYKKGRSTSGLNIADSLSISSLPDSFFDGSRKGLILAGPDHQSNYHEEVIELAKKLKAPILADPLSNFRNFDEAVIIDAYDAFLADEQVKQALKPDYILQFGQMMVSKRVQQFIASHAEADFVQVSPSYDYRNPALTTNHILKSDVASFAQSIEVENQSTDYLELWQTSNQKMRQKLNLVSTEAAAFEGRYVSLLQELMPADSQLLSANSMEIRDLDYFWTKKNQSVRILGNRGVNGIDGTESTALGISTTGKPTVMLTGDLSMLHDMSGLVVGKTEQLNLTIILFNNDGGGIFYHLAQKGVPNFDYLFATPHGLDFGGLAQLMGLDYHLIKDYADFEVQFKQAINQDGIHLLEIKTDKDLSLALHKKYTSYED